MTTTTFTGRKEVVIGLPMTTHHLAAITRELDGLLAALEDDMSTTTTTPYAVNHWGSKPGTNDDCWTGWDFATLAEARAKYEETPKDPSAAWVELDGPDVHEERKNPAHRDEPDDLGDYYQEQRMQAAMAFGVQGWNDWS